MKQAILDIIDRKMGDNTYHDCDNDENPMMYGERILQELREEIENLSEWIDLEDEYPQDNTRVLASKEEYVDTCQGYASEHSGRWVWDSYIRYTHWMPLPLPPHPSSHDNN